MTPETCGAVGEMALVILVWMRALGVENPAYPWRLGVTRIRHISLELNPVQT